MIITQFRPATTPPRRTFRLATNQRMLLMPIGDVHFGAPGFPAEKFVAHIRWGVERGAYFLAMGDMMEFTSRSQRGHLYNLRDSQREIIDQANEREIGRLVKLIVFSKGRWITWLEGDHFHEFLDGSTSDQRLCRALGGTFGGTSTYLQLRLQNAGRGKAQEWHGCDIPIYLHHGFGSGRLVGANLHAIERLMHVIEADIYLMAHTHSKANAPVDRLYVTPGGYLYHRTKLLARTGGWLRGYMAQGPLDGRPARESRGSYVERAAYAPSTLGGIVISLGWKRITHDSGGRRTEDFYVPDIHYSV